MPLANEFSDCCLEIPNTTPSSLLSTPVPLSTWHRVGERFLRRFRFILRGPVRHATR